MAIVSLSRRLADQAAADPSRPAITCGERSVTRAKLETAADPLARQLLEDGVKFGDMVAHRLAQLRGLVRRGRGHMEDREAIPEPPRHGSRLVSWGPSSSWLILRCRTGQGRSSPPSDTRDDERRLSAS